jgi:hypothetical protein
MSKASEFAKRAAGLQLNESIRFVVNYAGGMNLSILGHSTSVYTPQEALALAHWIIDTFSDGKEHADE